MNNPIISNETVKQVLIGIPSGHKHLRIIIQIGENWVVFPEAVVANLVRGYTTIVTHPQKKVLHFLQKKLENPKQYFASYQLLEQHTSEAELQKKLDQLWESLSSRS